MLHRQPSRHFDAYGALPAAGLFSPDDQMAQQNFAPRYDRVNAATLNSSFPFVQDPWNSFPAAQSNGLAALSATTRMKSLTNRGGRAGLPTVRTPQPWLDRLLTLYQTWLDNPMPGMPPFPGLGNGALGHGMLRPDGIPASEPDEELIPTAIVIKNIPFAVKKEQLVQIMTDIGLPLPYAFNYHFDNGVFRGLAFANFTTADETALVIAALNNYEIYGRKLRVEYKKMLPQAERDRIEERKRRERGQLQEQHEPSNLRSQASMGSMSSGPLPRTSPSPVSLQAPKNGWYSGACSTTDLLTSIEYDLNDPDVLRFYTMLVVFQNDKSRDSLVFPSTLSPQERRIVHVQAHNLGLVHLSKGEGAQRAVHVFRMSENPNNISPPLSQMPANHLVDSQRRALNRAATTDFSDVRGDGFYGTLGRQGSGLLGFADSAGGLPNLRAAKSYADLRSYTPSPVPSTASFPATLNTNLARFAEYGHNGATSSNPNLAATATSMAAREDSVLVNGMSGMSLGGGFGQGGSPRSLRGTWERDTPGPIGGHRSFSTANFDDQNRDRSQGLPARQPRGPVPERGTGFSRPRQNGHSGRGSDELSSSQSGVEILVEQ